METISQLRPDEIAEYVRAHIIMQAATYAHLAHGDFPKLLWRDFEHRVAELTNRCTDGHDGGVDLVARSERGGIVGIAQTRHGVENWELGLFGDDWMRPAATRVLKSLFLMPGTQGTGLGRRLLEAALPDDEPTYLWVMTENIRAVRFYEHHGFVADGFEGISAGWGDMRMQRMVRLRGGKTSPVPGGRRVDEDTVS